MEARPGSFDLKLIDNLKTDKIMKKTRKEVLMLYFTTVISCSIQHLCAQLTLSAQIRPRTEFRNGFGTLKPKTGDAAFFTSQRSRLTVNYRMSRIILQVAVQDIRVWGQDASTINNADGIKLGLHEAWGEIVLSDKKDTTFKKSLFDYFAVRIGRQEILYDDSRLMGNLDWLQQARHHDAVVFKLLNKGWQTDLGLAFNQNTDAFNYNGTYYTPANVSPYVKDSKGNLAPTPAGMIPLTNATGVSLKTGAPAVTVMPSTNGLNQDYKSLQYLYVAKTFRGTKITGLAVADQFGRYALDSVQNISGKDTGYIFGKHFDKQGVNSRFTAGFFIISTLNQSKSLSLTAGLYYQTGKDRDGNSLAAFTSTMGLSFVQGKFSYTAGWDYVSGNTAFSASSINHRFDPLYGTPHKFWGLMDYFYAGTGSPPGGLNNPFIKTKYNSSNNRFFAGLDYHYFSLANDQKDVNAKALKKYLGSEIDVFTSYVLNRFTTIEWGFSIMAATKSMEYAKGIAPGAASLTGTWSYLMINIKPEFIFGK